jgi:hypothetical protein
LIISITSEVGQLMDHAVLITLSTVTYTITT